MEPGIDVAAFVGLLADLGGPSGPAESGDSNAAGEIVLSYTPNNLDAHARLTQQLQKLLQVRTCVHHGANCHQGLFNRNLFVGQRIALAGVAHQNGTIRFGRDPSSSALDINCKAHELDNLYVVDGSFFPSCGAVNPSLTIVANAMRVAEHLLSRMTPGSRAA